MFKQTSKTDEKLRSNSNESKTGEVPGVKIQIHKGGGTFIHTKPQPAESSTGAKQSIAGAHQAQAGGSQDSGASSVGEQDVAPEYSLVHADTKKAVAQPQSGANAEDEVKTDEIILKISPPDKNDAIDVVIKRDEPNDRVGIVFRDDFPDRAIVKDLIPGTPGIGLIEPLDEIFTIGGIPCTSAKHCVSLIRKSNALAMSIRKLLWQLLTDYLQ